MAKNQKTTPRRVRSPHHLKKMYFSWRLRVLRHGHSGRRMHRQHTSFPLVGLLALVGALLLVPSTGTVLAAGNPDYLVVTAVVSGPPPSAAATIDTPADGADFTEKPITVTGTCPTDSYVQLFRNNVPSGTALCAKTGTYALQTDLFKGANELVAKVYNYAMVAGPDSNSVTVTYTPPVTPEPPVDAGGSTGGNTTGNTNGGTPGSTGSGTYVGGITGSGGSPGSAANNGNTGTTGPAPGAPLLLRNDYVFTGFYVGQAMTQRIGINGGTAPYAVSVKWGDGQESLYTGKSADTLTLTHTYALQSSRDRGYVITVNATDADGNAASLQILAIVNDLPGTGAAGGTASGGPAMTLFGLTVQQFVFYVWSTYGTVCLVVFGFWLGELRELRLIRTKFRLRRL